MFPFTNWMSIHYLKSKSLNDVIQIQLHKSFSISKSSKQITTESSITMYVRSNNLRNVYTGNTSVIEIIKLGCFTLAPSCIFIRDYSIRSLSAATNATPL